MNGHGKIFLLLALATGCAAAYYVFKTSGASTDSDPDGSTGAGDASGSGASGGVAAAYQSTLEGIGNAAASLGYTLGISTPKGLRNHNPGNLRYVASVPWNGQVGDDGTGYAVFDTDEHGVRALGHQLQTYSSLGLNTVTAIITRSAPSTCLPT